MKLTCITDGQDLQLMTPHEIEKQAHMCYHFRERPPLSQWLQDSQNEEDKARLAAVGNLVIPRCASLAMHLLGSQSTN